MTYNYGYPYDYMGKTSNHLNLEKTDNKEENLSKEEKYKLATTQDYQLQQALSLLKGIHIISN